MVLDGGPDLMGGNHYGRERFAATSFLSQPDGFRDGIIVIADIGHIHRNIYYFQTRQEHSRQVDTRTRKIFLPVVLV
jgi:hypothetical protein